MTDTAKALDIINRELEILFPHEVYARTTSPEFIADMDARLEQAGLPVRVLSVEWLGDELQIEVTDGA